MELDRREFLALALVPLLPDVQTATVRHPWLRVARPIDRNVFRLRGNHSEYLDLFTDVLKVRFISDRPMAQRYFQRVVPRHGTRQRILQTSHDPTSKEWAAIERDLTERRTNRSKVKRLRTKAEGIGREWFFELPTGQKCLWFYNFIGRNSIVHPMPGYLWLQASQKTFGHVDTWWFDPTKPTDFRLAGRPILKGIFIAQS